MCTCGGRFFQLFQTNISISRNPIIVGDELGNSLKPTQLVKPEHNISTNRSVFKTQSNAILPISTNINTIIDACKISRQIDNVWFIYCYKTN